MPAAHTLTVSRHLVWHCLRPMALQGYMRSISLWISGLSGKPLRICEERKTPQVQGTG